MESCILCYFRSLRTVISMCYFRSLRTVLSMCYFRSIKTVISMWLDTYPVDFHEPPSYSSLCSLRAFARHHMSMSDLPQRCRDKIAFFQKLDEIPACVSGKSSSLPLLLLLLIWVFFCQIWAHQCRKLASFLQWLSLISSTNCHHVYTVPLVSIVIINYCKVICYLHLVNKSIFSALTYCHSLLATIRCVLTWKSALNDNDMMMYWLKSNGGRVGECAGKIVCIGSNKRGIYFLVLVEFSWLYVLPINDVPREYTLCIRTECIVCVSTLQVVMKPKTCVSETLSVSGCVCCSLAEDVCLDFNLGILSLSSNSSNHQKSNKSLLETVSSRHFAEQLTCVDAVSCLCLFSTSCWRSESYVWWKLVLHC